MRFLVGKQGRALKTWAINKRMIEIGLAQSADVYHSHDLNTLYIGAMCKKRTKARLVYDSHELQTERNRMTKWWRRWAAWNEKKWLPYADAMIVASPSWIGINRKKYGKVPDPSVSIINTPALEIIDKPEDLRGELGLSPDVPILLYQGSIQENRGIEPAIDAITLLDDAVLVVVGYGYYRPVLEAEVRKRGLTDRVKFFGPIPNDELLGWTAAADIGLCNIVNSSLSYYTSLPNKLFEYIIAGIAVIGSDSPEIGRIVQEEGVGEVADPIDPEDLARATRTILADIDRYRAATKPAAQKYNWAIEEQKLLGIYSRF
ncbi:MAG: glycosyltransferase family 4 protein [Acidimicrobiia bacterium]|nr:glycosyltransferase family 4 protein [Acidimicrobiia bacterium]